MNPTHPHPANPPGTGLHRKMPAEEIHALPLVTCPLAIHFIREPHAVHEAARELAKERLLGFDTETRPTFQKGDVHPPALLQLAGSQAVYIFRLLDLGLPHELQHILADPAIIKAGVAVGRDLAELKSLARFEPAGFVDLGTVARENNLQHHGLRGMAALLLGCRVSKGARLTNWSRANLPDLALTYAATDAWIGRRLYETLCELPNIHGIPRAH